MVNFYLDDLVREEKLSYEDVVSRSVDSDAIHGAALPASPELCEWLIEARCDVNKRSAFFGSPLCCAILGCIVLSADPMQLQDDETRGHRPGARKKVVQILLDASCDANYQWLPPSFNRDAAVSAVQVALLFGDVGLAALLLEIGAVLSGHSISFVQDKMNQNKDWSEYKYFLQALSLINYKSRIEYASMD